MKAALDLIRRVWTSEGFLRADGWRQGNDGFWRNDRFGGSYKTENAIKRIGSRRGEITR